MIDIIVFYRCPYIALAIYIVHCALVKYLNVGSPLGLITVRKKECLDAWILKVLQVGFEPPTLCSLSLQRSVHYITIYVYGKHVGIFPCLLFCSIKS
jgi:hypothetical protein